MLAYRLRQFKEPAASLLKEEERGKTSDLANSLWGLASTTSCYFIIEIFKFESKIGCGQWVVSAFKCLYICISQTSLESQNLWIFSI